MCKSHACAVYRAPFMPSGVRTKGRRSRSQTHGVATLISYFRGFENTIQHCNYIKHIYNVLQQECTNRQGSMLIAKIPLQRTGGGGATALPNSETRARPSKTHEKNLNLAVIKRECCRFDIYCVLHCIKYINTGFIPQIC